MKKYQVHFLLIFFPVIIVLGIISLSHIASDKKASQKSAESGDGGISESFKEAAPQSPDMESAVLAPDESSQKEEKAPIASPSPKYPAEIINLANWKQTLPTGNSKKPKEIKQPELARFVAEPYFRIHTDGDRVICRAPVNGVTTSNSGYPRSELREMTDNGKRLASWSTTSGTNIMILEQAITAVPKNKRHVVAGQIHGPEDDIIVIRLEYPKLFVDINGKQGPVLDPNYKLGKKFTVKFVASDGKIMVYYNGNPDPSYTLKKKTSGCYFKAGAYTQSNCSKEKDCSSSNFGEVEIYNLQVSHS